MSHFRARRHRALRIKPPEVVLARQLEELMLAAGMPASYTKDEFGQWHARLYATDETYRDGHRQLMAMVKAKRAQ